MIGKLVFKLPEEREEFKIAQNGGAALSVLHSIDQKLRSEIKYGNHPEAKAKIYQEIRAMLWEEINSSGVGDLV